jgi:hypothetical protein
MGDLGLSDLMAQRARFAAEQEAAGNAKLAIQVRKRCERLIGKLPSHLPARQGVPVEASRLPSDCSESYRSPCL